MAYFMLNILSANNVESEVTNAIIEIGPSYLHQLLAFSCKN